ncbi:hypothetical protein ACHAXT_010690 [Thalassiosira profunda]
MSTVLSTSAVEPRRSILSIRAIYDLLREEKEYTQLMKKRMEVGDANALYIHGLKTYHNGSPDKAIDLYYQAADLGSMKAHGALAYIFCSGEVVAKDEEKGFQHLQIAAMGGLDHVRHRLGNAEMKRGNALRAMKHWMISARAGWDKSLAEVKEGYKEGLVTKDEFAAVLRAHKESNDELRSPERDRAAAMRPKTPTY